MTDSMVAKLTDKELSAIFSLTEKLHQRKKAVAAITAEKEELAGKLQGTEALKEFLINKVRDVELSLKKSQEDEIKVTQQISSDQEVIAFLDGRVQELERNVTALTDEKKKIVEKMASMQTQNEKKIEVLSDMLQFERERVSTNEREWKTTKKLLVKEIKSCRAQLMALQAERDGFREQNERLKKAVLSMNPSIVNGGM
jgi:chromosome segregation ATPase